MKWAPAPDIYMICSVSPEHGPAPLNERARAFLKSGGTFGQDGVARRGRRAEPWYVAVSSYSEPPTCLLRGARLADPRALEAARWSAYEAVSEGGWLRARGDRAHAAVLALPEGAAQFNRGRWRCYVEGRDTQGRGTLRSESVPVEATALAQLAWTPTAEGLAAGRAWDQHQRRCSRHWSYVRMLNRALTLVLDQAVQPHPSTKAYVILNGRPYVLGGADPSAVWPRPGEEILDLDASPVGTPTTTRSHDPAHV